MFCWKTFCIYSFPHFPVFDSTKKTWSMENYLWLMENLIKIKLIFYRLFSFFFFFGKTISLSRVASSINIIFVYSREKHNFLASSLSHGKFSHFFSPHTLTVTNFSLSSSHISLSLTVSLLSFLHVSLPLYNTILWLDFFFPSLIGQ